MDSNYPYQNNARAGAVSRLAEAYSNDSGPALTEGPKIKVSAAVSTLASAYEKVRRAMEYNEPHLQRRATTERILARRLRGESNSALVAKGLVNELIRGRYLKNDYYPESLSEEVEGILEKYRVILEMRDVSPTHDDFPWIVRLASSEVEEFFSPPEKDDALAELALLNLKETVIISDPNLSENQRLIQLRLAIYKNLLKLDQAMLEYNLFELFYPYWKTHGREHVEEVVASLPQIRKAIDGTLNYPLAGSISASVRRYVAPFILFRDALEHDGVEVFTDKLILSRAISTSYKRRMERERERLATTTTRALIYIFLTKAVLSFAFELPAERLIYGAVRKLPFAINFLFPPFLLFLLTLSLSLPGEENEERIVSAAREAAFGNGDAFSEKNRVEVKKRSPGMAFILFVLYLLTFAIMFGGVAYLLAGIGFTPFAVALFIFYTSIVMYFGVKVRESSQELIMIGGHETVSSVVFDFLALPFLRVGSFVSSALSRFNVLVIAVSLLVEAPIQSLLEFLEEWIHFAREKKEEVY
ncbi:hypothetical protein GTO10_01465 [Candidatus Saccharibacteria bacterium]|nr:hypothetical protein [Candidatus Saccharibacteria bacterium]